MFCVMLENGVIISYKVDANSLNEEQRAALLPKLTQPANTKEKKAKIKCAPHAGRQLLLPLFRLVR